MTDSYVSDIARVADSPRAMSPAQLRQIQSEMWARHRYEAWRTADTGTLTGEHVARGTSARARTIAGGI